MTFPQRSGADVVIAGGGMIGAACALACAQAGLKTVVVERDLPGGGATAACMGHIVVLDDNEAQFALCRRSQQLWQQMQGHLSRRAEFETIGTLWVAEDDEEMAEAARKQAFLLARDVPGQLITQHELHTREPQLRPGLAGGLLVPQDAVVFPPVAVDDLLKRAQAEGAIIRTGAAVLKLAQGEALLSDGSVIQAPRLVNALGAEAADCTEGLPVRKRKGQLAVTDRYPGFLRHQIVELGYMKSAAKLTAESVACNVQPRPTGQMLIGSSRQFENEDRHIDQRLLARMLQRCAHYLPGLADLQVLRVWSGFRASTPDKLPLIGQTGFDATLWLATGHEGLGITTAPATAELLVNALTGREQVIPITPFLPTRFDALRASTTSSASLQEFTQ
jgi:glycine/D-amino acid oxidase-like deaminating enzyme